MRSSPSFNNRPRLGFHQSLLFFCLSFPLVTAFRPRGVSPSFNLSSRSFQVDTLPLRLSRSRKRDLPAGPPSQDVELNSATTAGFDPLSKAHNSSDAHNSSSPDATNSSHASSSSPSNTLESNHPSGAVHRGILNVSSNLGSIHEHDPPPASTSPAPLSPGSDQRNSSTTQTIVPNQTTLATSNASRPFNYSATETHDNHSSANVAPNLSKSLSTGNISDNDYTKTDQPFQDLTTSPEANISIPESHNHTSSSSAPVPVPKDSHSEPSTNASSLSANSSASLNATGNPVGVANRSYASAGALDDLKHDAIPVIGQVVVGGKQNPIDSSRNTSSPNHGGENSTIGPDSSDRNLSADAMLTNPVAKSDVAAAALADLDKTRKGANVSAHPEQGGDQARNASSSNETHSSLSSTASVHFGDDSTGARASNLTSNSTNGAFLNSTLANSDAAATALGDLNKTRTGSTVPASAYDGDGNTNSSSSPPKSGHNVSSLPLTTSAHFGASTAPNLTENRPGGTLLGNNESAAAALIGLEKAKNDGVASAPSSGAQNNSHNLSSSILGFPQNASSLSSTTVAHFGNDSVNGDSAYNFTRNHTDDGALAPSHAAGALTALNKTRTGVNASTPSGDGDSVLEKTPSPIGSAKNISSPLSSATSAHFGTDSANDRTDLNLTGNQTNGSFLNSTYLDSKVAGAALTDLNKNRTGVITSIPPGKDDDTFQVAESHVGSSQNISSFSSATSAHFGNDSATGSGALNLTQNLTQAALLNGTFANSEAAGMALGPLGKAEAGVNSSANGASIDKAHSRLESEALGHNLTNVDAFNVTRNSTNGSLPNTDLDAGVTTALAALNKTKTGVNGTMGSLLGQLNGSNLSVAYPANATGLNTTGISPITTLVPGSDASGGNSTTVLIHPHVNSTRLNNTELGQGALGLHHNANATSASADTNHSAIAPPSPAPAFVPVSTLFTNPVTPQPAPTTPSPKVTADTTKHAKPDPPAPFPTTWPKYIVPSNVPTTAPENTTLISILFSNSLNWPWLVTNSNASSQVLVFMPELVATALHIDASQVVTQSLQAYQPTSFNSQNEGSMLTVWLGYIPSQYVDELQAMLKAPQSAFYKQDNPIYDALGKTVDSSLPITTFSSQAHAAQQAAAVSASSSQPQSSGDQGQKMAVIASVTSCGAAILAIGLFLAARQSKQKFNTGGTPFPGSGAAGRNLRPLRLSSGNRLQISAPMIGSLSHRAGHSHYYGQAAQAQPEQQPRLDLQSFPSFPSLATGMSVMAEDGGHGPMVEVPVHYEYGHAHTTSTDLQHATSSRARVDLRSSWWRAHSEEAMNDCDLNQHSDSLRVQTSASPSSPPSRGLGRKISSRKSDGSFGMESHQRPAHRRLQITRGADGLVSGIGRPVMKENSLFF